MTGEATRGADGRVSFRLERLLSHPPEKVWLAITAPEHLSAWYPFPVRELDLRVGGVISFDDGEGGTLDGQVIVVEPEQVFAFREVDDVLRLELHPEPPGCRLVLIHTFAEGAGYQNLDTGWQRCLDELVARLTV